MFVCCTTQNRTEIPLIHFFLHIWAAVLYQFNMIKYINLKPEQLNKTVLNNKKQQSHVITRAFWKQTDLVFLHTRCVTAPRYWLRDMLSSSDSLHINEWVIIRDSQCWKRQPTLLNSINQLLEQFVWSVGLGEMTVIPKAHRSLSSSKNYWRFLWLPHGTPLLWERKGASAETLAPGF